VASLLLKYFSANAVDTEKPKYLQCAAETQIDEATQYEKNYED
jgi:hypothetical protein